MRKNIRHDGISFTDDSGKTIASISEHAKEEKVWRIKLNGSVNNDCAYDIADELFALISVGNGIILDMSDTVYLSSTFAEQLVQLQIHMENTDFESMPIINMPAEVFQTLKTQGCITSLDYELKEERES